ncbi:ABC transporter permease subunit [Promicromonospora soli]|uniref:ABC transporter permease n=1 Tax=Promicromonospora soli TaxID=2035533 RepID=A0A919G0M2_9MICO|nr:ABC transporter permease subunit [Promicromonospora soli]GHH75992.1 ABC transporter permease [Promicromonospora soli]
MSATVTARAGGPASGTTAEHTPVQNVTFWRLLRSEWVKLWTLRSTWWTLGSTVVIMVGVALMMSFVVQFVMDEMGAGEMSPEDQASMGGIFGAPTVIAGGYEFAALVVAVLGAMVITGEYSTGMIRSTFAAAPGRLGAFAAKATVLAVVTAVLTTVSLLLSWLVSYPILNANDMALDWSDGDQLQKLYGVVIYTVLVALFALGIGTLLRHTAGAIFTAVAVFLVIPMVFGIAVALASNVDWVLDVNKFLPSVAGSAITPSGAQVPEVLDPWVGVSVLAAYTAVVVIGGAFRLKLDDA